MAKGKKNCPLCGQENRATAKACLHCAHPFKAGGEIISQPAESPKTPEPPPERPKFSGGNMITTPAGKPPCAPKVVENFKGHERNLNYAPEAVRYWARYFWPIGSHEYVRVCAIIDKLRSGSLSDGGL